MKNLNEITLKDNSIDLAKAFDLINDYGTIILETDIINQNDIIFIKNKKNITLHGNQHVIENYQINNIGNLTINNTIFQTETVSPV